MKTPVVTAVLGGASTALAAVRGFNYGAQGQSQADFEASFRTAAALEGADDFTSARLYTMIQEGTTNTPIDAIPAAIDTSTTLLLGLWTSVDQATFDNELAALKSAMEQYGSDFTDLVVGISVGSEDLYRISETGLENDPIGVGQTPDVLVDYIGQVREAIQGTPLGAIPVGHVDTWNAFINESNSAVIEACDFLGLDEYPYYQTTDANGIENGKTLFFEAYDKVAALAPGKQIWVTEAGWPVSGEQSGDAVASVENAEIFWQEVSCELQEREINFWWYILEDSTEISFSVSKGGQPLYDLSCNNTSDNSTSGSNSTSTISTSKNSTSTISSSTISRNSTAYTTGSLTATSVSGAAATATGSGSSSDGSSASGSSDADSPNVSTFSSGTGKIEGGIAGLVLAIVMAAFAL